MAIRVKTINPETSINNLDDEINEFIKAIEADGDEVIDIKYDSVYDDNIPAATYTALITYKENP